MISKYAIVTGASQGLGFELVREGAKRGYVIFAIDKKISEELKILSGKGIHIIQCDISSEKQLESCFDEIISVTDSIDILINCAGIWLDRERKRLDSTNFDFDAVFRQFEINAVGALRILQNILKNYPTGCTASKNSFTEILFKVLIKNHKKYTFRLFTEMCI